MDSEHNLSQILSGKKYVNLLGWQLLTRLNASVFLVKIFLFIVFAIDTLIMPPSVKIIEELMNQSVKIIENLCPPQ